METADGRTPLRTSCADLRLPILHFVRRRRCSAAFRTWAMPHSQVPLEVSFAEVAFHGPRVWASRSRSSRFLAKLNGSVFDLIYELSAKFKLAFGVRRVPKADTIYMFIDQLCGEQPRPGGCEKQYPGNMFQTFDHQPTLQCNHFCGGSGCLRSDACEDQIISIISKVSRYMAVVFFNCSVGHAQ